MKLLTMATFLIFSTITQASVINFQCKSVKVPGVNTFFAKGIVTIDNLKQVDGVINIGVQKIDEDESIQVFEQIKISGVFKHFKPGEVTANSFIQLILTTDNQYIKSLNLLLDERSALSSQIFSIDNFLYRSNCEAIGE